MKFQVIKSLLYFKRIKQVLLNLIIKLINAVIESNKCVLYMFKSKRDAVDVVLGYMLAVSKEFTNNEYQAYMQKGIA